MRSNEPSQKVRYLREPAIELAQRFRLQRARSPLRLAAARDQAGGLQHFQMPRDGRQGDVERFGQVVHRRRALAEAGEDGAAGGICEGRQGLGERVRLVRN